MSALAGLFEPSAAPSRLDRIDPRLRVGVALATLLALALIRSVPVLAVSLVLALMLTLYAGLPLRRTLARLALVESFLALLVITLPFAVPGEPIFALWGLAASAEGFWRAVALVLRVGTGVLIIFALVAPLGSAGLARALGGLGLPPALVQMLQLCVRYIGVLGEERARLTRAMRARAFVLRSTGHAWRSLGYLIGMLLVRSLERAERVGWAMKCRGYAGRWPAEPFAPLGVRDYGFAALTLIGLAALVWAGHAP